MNDEYTLSDKVFSGRRFLVLMAGIVFLLFGFSIAFGIAVYVENKEAMTILAVLFGHCMTVILAVYNRFFDKDRNGNGHKTLDDNQGQ